MSSGLLDNRLQVIVCHPAIECISADVMIIPLTSDRLDMRQSVIGHLIADLGKYHRCTRYHYHYSIKQRQESDVKHTFRVDPMNIMTRMYCMWWVRLLRDSGF